LVASWAACRSLRQIPFSLALSADVNFPFQILLPLNGISVFEDDLWFVQRDQAAAAAARKARVGAIEPLCDNPDAACRLNDYLLHLFDLEQRPSEAQLLVLAAPPFKSLN